MDINSYIEDVDITTLTTFTNSSIYELFHKTKKSSDLNYVQFALSSLVVLWGLLCLLDPEKILNIVNKSQKEHQINKNSECDQKYLHDFK